MSNLSNLMSCFASEVVRFNQRCEDVKKELFPKSCTEMLPEWESILGITASGTIEDRRAAILSKLNATGGASIEYFYSIARILGYATPPDALTGKYFQILTGQYPPFIVGVSLVGDYMWTNTISGSIFQWQVTGSAEFLADTNFQKFLTDNKPAHTVLTIG